VEFGFFKSRSQAVFFGVKYTAMDSINMETAVALLSYSACSSLMLIANKMAITNIPLPSLVTLVQLISCTAFIFALSARYPNLVSFFFVLFPLCVRVRMLADPRAIH
jgi:hypothetical protein